MRKLHYAVLGYPLEHTLSPPLHQKLFAISGLNAEYTKFELAPQEFGKRIEDLFTINGFNITMPYKQRIIPFLEGATEEALRFQSINTILIQPSGDKIGHNTDIAGVIKSFELLGVTLRSHICIAGAGATARMIATETIRRGGRVTIAVRQGSLQKGQALAGAVSRLSARPCTEVRTLETLDEAYDLLVNATPCGMYPQVDCCPFSDRTIARAGAVFDLVYNPAQTVLLKKARAMGKPALGGLHMLVWQAAAAHEFWYGARFTAGQIAGVVDELRKIL